MRHLFGIHSIRKDCSYTTIFNSNVSSYSDIASISWINENTKYSINTLCLNREDTTNTFEELLCTVFHTAKTGYWRENYGPITSSSSMITHWNDSTRVFIYRTIDNFHIEIAKGNWKKKKKKLKLNAKFLFLVVLIWVHTANKA